ncbi:hypothetical protein Aduo_005152 [Ancylostoma duodenale]
MFTMWITIAILSAVCSAYIKKETNWTKLEATGFHYKGYWSDAFTKFEEAEKKCHDLGAYLVSIHSKEENEFVNGLVGGNSPEDIIAIGLKGKNSSSSWRWTDGSVMDFSHRDPKGFIYEDEGCFLVCLH